MIDSAYTTLIRSEHDKGGDVTHMVVTEEEIDWLMDAEDDDFGDGIIALTEEAVYRSTGLKVDLSAEGPARSVVIRAGDSELQEHNTFIVSNTGINTQNLIDVERDVDSIPKVTPQDVNYATRSLDFPMTRPINTALDGMGIDDRVTQQSMLLCHP